MRMKYSTEKDFLDDVEKCLKENGCNTWREVIPDGCENWEKPYRVDLIFYKEGFGFGGIEGKNTNTLNNGKDISDAVDQINTKYKNKTYFKGNIISNWSIAFPIEMNEDIELNRIYLGILSFIKNFIFIRYGIGIVEYTPEIKYLSGKKTSKVAIYQTSSKSLLKVGGEFIKYG